MGENEAWAEPGGPLPNGLLPGAGRVMLDLDIDRWSKAEDRTAELIACIQPNQFSEERRNAVADYVQRLIMKCFPCQVCTFGSVPLKTYLPDGDIDLTAFSHDQSLKDSWANQVRDMLENEEKNENAEFHVKEVQYIQAEVKIIKCLVENIVVDISFNQVGGLCTLCFLDEVDNLINQNHLFKRSIILIKAWCYYESRILGAHHGLISTYALETLVLYIFHVFNNSFHGPLEVLYRFLEFFSNFDWDNFCVSLWGPVPISSLPDVTAEPPRKDSGELLLSKLFLDACSSVYAVFPGGQENNGQPFVSKHFNVIDPLRVNNNLGRSVSKGNFFRIRSAFAFGAKRLARLLDCAKENITFEVNQFFLNTWERHGSGKRPDAPGFNSRHGNLSTPDGLLEVGNPNINTKWNNSTDNSSIHEMEDKGNRGRLVSSQHSKTTPASRMQSLKSQNLNILRVADQNEEDQRNSKADHLVNDTQGRFLFSRTLSSPELSTSNRRKNLGPAEEIRNIPSQQSIDADEVLTSSGAMNQEEQDIVNMMASASLQGFNSQIHVPFNLHSAHHLPFSIPPSFLASVGYNQQNLPGFVSGNIPLIDPSFSNMQFPHGLVPPQLNHYFHSPAEFSFERTNENFGPLEMNSDEVDNDFWPQEQDVCSSAGYDPENGNFEMLQSDDNKPPQASVSGLKYIPPPRVSGSTKGQQKNAKEKRGSMRQNSSDSFPNQDEIYAEERSASSRFSSAAHSSSLRSRTSSESSWDGSSVKTPKSTKPKQGKKTIISPDVSTDHGKGKIMSEHGNDDDQEWGSFPNVGPTETMKRNSGPDSMMPYAPMLIRPGSRQRNDDNSGLIFYPTGPPIPFLTMLPFYNIPPETSPSDEALESSESGQNFSSEGFEHSEDQNLNSLRGMTTTSTTASETSERKKPDILNSDFASHWQNLQFGRFCQNPRHQGPLLYHSPVVVPPVYLQGARFPFDNPGRPVSSTNMNLFSQLMTSYGQRVAPVSPLQSVSNRPPNMYQRYVDEMPRYRSGTGTYLPNPKISPRDRHSSGNRRGNYSHDRNDNYNDREGNWNASKSRAALRRNQSDKSNSRADKSERSWNSYRHESVPSYQSQNGPLASNSSQDVPYSMYPLAATNPNGASNGPPVPPVVMLYPFDHNAANYGSHSEQLEFGSLGPVGLPGMDEQPSLNEGARARTFEDHRLHGSRSSPDQPSSPHHQRRL